MPTLRTIAAWWLVIGFIQMTAHAQSPAWTRRMVIGPAGRGDLAMAFDSTRQRTVLFGGTTDGFNGTDDTWEWNGTSWSERPVSGPSLRLLNAMAYDSVRHVTVLFGGINQNTIYGDTWEWDGTTWAQRPATGPSSRWAHTMCYDSARGVTVLFGGYTGGSHNAETWEWNGSVWTQRAGGPPPRFGSAMAYDSARHVTVLFGGSNAGSPNLSDTWEWNGATWTLRQPASAPSARYFHTMAYDAGRAVTVLFGGTNSSGIPTGETWEWNGAPGVWTQRSITGPAPREAPAMAYDSARAQTVLFGGYSAGWNGETWELGVSCTAPSISSQPAAQTACPSGAAAFSVVASGSGPLSYLWQLETAPGVWQSMGNDPAPLPCGGGAFGYATPIDSAMVQIGIRPCPGVGRYQIRCIVSNSCGSAASNEATYTICIADFDDGSGSGHCDGGVTIDDLLYYLGLFSQGFVRADIDDGSGSGTPDGGVTIEDLLFYLARFAAGC